jgi:two-component SAPR family response regulator
MIRVVIVDDEYSSGKFLEIKLRNYSEVIVERVFHDVTQFKRYIACTRIDVCFLDIEMPVINGLELAEELNRAEKPPAIVFVTAFKGFSLDAFKVNAVDYLLKPVTKEELDRVVQKLSRILKFKVDVPKEEDTHLSQDLLDVTLLGHVTFYYHNKPVYVKFPVAKSLELVCFLLLRLKQRADKWCIIDALWQDKDMVSGWNTLRTTVYRTNQGFKKAGLKVRIRAEKSIYYLDPPVHLRDLVNLENTSIDDICKYLNNGDIESIKGLYPGHLLQEKDYIWLYEKDAYYSSLYFRKMNAALDQCILLGADFLNSMLPLVFENIEFTGLLKEKLTENNSLKGIIDFFNRHPAAIDDIADEMLQLKIKELLSL